MDTNPATHSPSGDRELRGLGFDAAQTAGILSLRRRYLAGAFREVTPRDRLLFARYLVEHGWLDEECHPRT